jgi:pullulanase-type alpha-1,6-glucosidase
MSRANIRSVQRSASLFIWWALVAWISGFVGIVAAADSADPSSVTMAGSFQSELGCPGDWQPDCAATHLALDPEDTVWQSVLPVPAGSWEYKAALNDSWAENYGLGAQRDGPNIPLALADPTDVKFYYSHTTHWVTDNVNSIIAVAPGSFQSEMGCAGDWDPGCLRSWLQDPDGDGIFSFSSDGIPAGSYEVKVAHNETWDENYGAGGVPNGPNIPFTVPTDGVCVTFEYDSVSHTLDVTPASAPCSAVRYAVIHYLRDDGDYGDHTTGDFDDFWGIHLWGDVAEIIEWTAPKPFFGEDEYGRFAWVRLQPDATNVGFIVHRGDVKDGTDADRFFDPSATPEIWLRSDDPATYVTQVQAQGFATIYYHRDDGDYGDPTSTDFNDFWGLHLWGGAIDPSEGTEWRSPKPPTGIDDYGAYWNILIGDPTQPLNFIIHRGDTKDPGPDQSFVPVEHATAWVQSGEETIYRQHGAAENVAVLHYRRPAGDYGDYSSSDYNDFWGLHTWEGADDPGWLTPRKPTGEDAFGVVFEVPLFPDAERIGYILHRGDFKDPGPDQFMIFAIHGYEVWQMEGADPGNPYILPIAIEAGGNPGNIDEQRAYWVGTDTIAWAAAEGGTDTYTLHYAPMGGLEATGTGITGGSFLTLAPDLAGLPADVQAKFPHLAALRALKIDPGDLPMVPEILRGQIAVSAVNGDGLSVDATGLQIPGVLDDLYTYDGELGVSWEGGIPTVRVWAPTAKSVNFLLFDDSGPVTPPSTITPMSFDPATGVWSLGGDPSWLGKYYLFEVEVYVHGRGEVLHNLATDPYSVSLAENSGKSQIVDLDDPSLKPAGWDLLAKPPLAAPEDISIYEIHVRDFSTRDPLVPDELKGMYKAFTLADTRGEQHLRRLRESGLTHLHLLPVFDIASVNEDRAAWQAPNDAVLATFPPDSDQQQALITAFQDQDGFNWGYDPWHYTVPDGSYATDPDGSTRIVEFREMVQALNEAGLRVVMDVVYNHTSFAGQNLNSVLDRIVPGYYHRLDERGGLETSSCCPNTASEHNMMEKLMIDSLVTWATQYKVDGFRFDLMGHHMKRNVENARAALDSLTKADDGVEGSSIYLYGEGWNFGEVADNARGVNATQLNMAGTGIGTYNDRLRDAVRGGSAFEGGPDLVARQGFANGLYYDPNARNSGSPGELDTLLLLGDQIRVGLAGNLANYPFIDRFGNAVTGAEVDYYGQPTGYAHDPQEVVNHVSSHDHQTLFDINVFKAPVSTSMADRIRIQNVGLSTVLLGQGVPFMHAGSDMLRSKSFDRDSYNSGDWFNTLDFTYQKNNFGAGLPVASVNQADWPVMQPLLAAPALVPMLPDIMESSERLQELLEIRYSSPLFRLQTEQQIVQMVRFHNTGPAQIPGLIVMSISDQDGAMDRDIETIFVLFNAGDDPVSFQIADAEGMEVELHPVLADSTDPVVQTSSFDSSTGTFEVPARTTAVFLGPRSAEERIDLLIDDTDSLEDDDVLNGGQANALRSKLSNALSKFERGQVKPAIHMLEAFINQVEALVSAGLLTEEEGNELITAAENVIASLSG